MARGQSCLQRVARWIVACGSGFSRCLSQSFFLHHSRRRAGATRRAWIASSRRVLKLEETLADLAQATQTPLKLKTSRKRREAAVCSEHGWTQATGPSSNLMGPTRLGRTVRLLLAGPSGGSFRSSSWRLERSFARDATLMSGTSKTKRPKSDGTEEECPVGVRRGQRGGMRWFGRRWLDRSYGSSWAS